MIPHCPIPIDNPPPQCYPAAGADDDLHSPCFGFDSLTPAGGDQRYAIRSASIARTAQATKQKDALKIGAPAAGGAIVGALLGGKKGALVGTAVGGGAGTAVVLSTRGKEVHLAKGTPLTLKLAAPVTIRVRG